MYIGRHRATAMAVTGLMIGIMMRLLQAGTETATRFTVPCPMAGTGKQGIVGIMALQLLNSDTWKEDTARMLTKAMTEEWKAAGFPADIM